RFCRKRSPPWQDTMAVTCLARPEFRGYQYTRCNRPATANIGGILGASVGSFTRRIAVCHGWNVMVPLFAQSWFRTSTAVTAAALCWCAMPARGDTPRNDYPTAARVEYVQECMTRNGGVLA